MNDPNHSAALSRMERASFAHPRRGRVEAVSLQVHAGELVGVCGAVGAGKSLLLRGAAGFDPAKAGTVWLLGQDLAGLDHDRLMQLRQRVAFASLSASILANLSVRENLEVPLRMRGMNREQARARVDELLGRLDLLEVAGRRSHEIPLRVLCRANVARALVLPAELYLLDEPSRGLSDRCFSLLGDEIRRLREAGAGFLISLGDPERWRGELDREVLLHGGDTPGAAT